MSHTERSPRATQVATSIAVGAAAYMSFSPEAAATPPHPVGFDILQHDAQATVQACVLPFSMVQEVIDTTPRIEGTYTIAQNDTLIALARTCLGVTLETPDPSGTVKASVGALSRRIREINGIDDPNALGIGQKVRIDLTFAASLRASLGQTPPSPEQPEPNQTSSPEAQQPSYSVQDGDTFSAIARAHNVSLAQLKALNPEIADYNVLRIGQRVTVPGTLKTENMSPSAGPPGESFDWLLPHHYRKLVSAIDPEHQSIARFLRNHPDVFRAAYEANGWNNEYMRFDVIASKVRALASEVLHKELGESAGSREKLFEIIARESGIGEEELAIIRKAYSASIGPEVQAALAADDTGEQAERLISRLQSYARAQRAELIGADERIASHAWPLARPVSVVTAEGIRTVADEDAYLRSRMGVPDTSHIVTNQAELERLKAARVREIVGVLTEAIVSLNNAAANAPDRHIYEQSIQSLAARLIEADLVPGDIITLIQDELPHTMNTPAMRQYFIASAIVDNHALGAFDQPEEPPEEDSTQNRAVHTEEAETGGTQGPDTSVQAGDTLTTPLVEPDQRVEPVQTPDAEYTDPSQYNPEGYQAPDTPQGIDSLHFAEQPGGSPTGSPAQSSPYSEHDINRISEYNRNQEALQRWADYARKQEAYWRENNTSVGEYGRALAEELQQVLESEEVQDTVKVASIMMALAAAVAASAAQGGGNLA